MKDLSKPFFDNSYFVVTGLENERRNEIARLFKQWEKDGHHGIIAVKDVEARKDFIENHGIDRDRVHTYGRLFIHGDGGYVLPECGLRNIFIDEIDEFVKFCFVNVRCVGMPAMSFETRMKGVKE